MPTPARHAAFDILLRVEQRQAYAAELLHSERLGELSFDDRALCTELVMGALRWRGRLDLGIGAVSSQPLSKLDPEVLTALRLGAYQIAFLRLPSRAAVNESVELVKHARRKYAAPFVNAVLRKLAARPELMKPALGPGAKTAVDLALLYSHPRWLVERWAARYGLETAEKICAYDQEHPPVAVRFVQVWHGSLTRVSPVGDSGPSGIEDELRREGVALAPGALLTNAQRVESGDLTHTRAFLEGRVAVQDEGSQLVALLVGHGERLLDCCAAPGGKTAVLAERNPQALVFAADLHPRRAALLRKRVTAPNVRVLAADAAAQPLSGEFDRVLADVPCSGTGTLARHPEIKWRLRPEDLADLHVRQVKILRAALERLCPGGRLVYASCSLEPEESAAVVEEVAARVLDVRQELQRLREAGELAWTDLESLCAGPYLRTISGVQPCDGFFAAVIEK